MFKIEELKAYVEKENRIVENIISVGDRSGGKVFIEFEENGGVVGKSIKPEHILQPVNRQDKYGEPLYEDDMVRDNAGYIFIISFYNGKFFFVCDEEFAHKRNMEYATDVEKIGNYWTEQGKERKKCPTCGHETNHPDGCQSCNESKPIPYIEMVEYRYGSGTPDKNTMLSMVEQMNKTRNVLNKLIKAHNRRNNER